MQSTPAKENVPAMPAEDTQDHPPQTAKAPGLLRWLTPAACLFALAGYFAPWVDNRVAGLVITGLDRGEYVKFLPAVRNGVISIWRQGFYIPLVAVSLSCSLIAYRRVWRFALPVKLALLLIAAVAALNMLPPAWSPAVLAAPEFRLQTMCITLCLAALAFSPFLGLLPALAAYAPILLLSLAGIWLPVSGLLIVLPDIQSLYRTPLAPGWGIYLMVIGLAGLAVSSVLGIRRERISDGRRLHNGAHN